MDYSLKIIKEVSYEKYETCVSCSLFRMTKSYRYFPKYVKEFKNLLEKVYYI